MTTAQWDPQQYLRHATHRSRPLRDLLSRIPEPPADAPRIADLGCGPGGPSALLAERWPTAEITGFDNSSAMLDEAAAYAGPTGGGGSLAFRHADLAGWRPAESSYDLIVSNAAFQWVPDHPALLPHWFRALRPGGTLAFQVPGNFTAPSHELLRTLCASARWRDRLGGVPRSGAPVLSPTGYFDLLAPLAAETDSWETTYIQLLTGPDPVLDWTRGTALRPVLTALADDPAAREGFLAEYRDALRTAYPAGERGTLFPFRRIFVVARRAAAPEPRRGKRAEPGIVGTDHVQLAAPPGSEDALRAFYGGVLGMTEVPKPPVLAARGGCWFQSGACQLHLGIEADFRPARKAHPGLRVRDLVAFVAGLERAGAAVVWDGSLPGHRRVYVDDPVGNRIELLERL